MSNLGPYQEIVMAAKQMGGVEKLIKSIEAGAVDGASTRQRLQGAGFAIAALAVVGGATYLSGLVSERRAARREAAESAKDELRRILPPDSDGPAVSPV